jgi:hypothetical protein
LSAAVGSMKVRHLGVLATRSRPVLDSFRRLWARLQDRGRHVTDELRGEGNADTNWSTARKGRAGPRFARALQIHVVRTRFLGNIARPRGLASPIRVVVELCGGELPPFDSIGEANELIGALAMGLWNRLTRHHERSSPRRLTRIETAPTREGLAAQALMRRQELDGFIEGLLRREKVVDLPLQSLRAYPVVRTCDQKPVLRP